VLELKDSLSTEQRSHLRNLGVLHETDVGFLPKHFKGSDIKVLAMDMDSTLINIECIDEIADAVGKKNEVSEITEAAMRGEIKDFSESLRRRVALLKGVPATALDEVFSRRLHLNPGTKELIAGAHAKGIHTLLVSGGFTFFTQKLQAQLNLSETHANQLEIIDGFLTGQVLGNIVDGAAKAAYVEARCLALGANKHAAIAMGDGSNDLLMMQGAGLSIAYRAKPIVKEKADVAFDHVSLDACLDLFN
jgi:phosphoserine phosphatase